MSRLMWILLSLCLMASPGSSREPIDWKSATVLHARYQLDSSTGVAGGGGATVARGDFEFDAGDVVYTATESLAPNLRMQLTEGDTVQFTTDKKTILLKLNGSKSRKLKLVSSFQKSRK